MIIRTMGFCARLNEKTAKKAVPYAEKYIKRKEGLCLSSSADLFLGDLGSLSRENAESILPLLELSVSNHVLNEQDWLLEAFIKVIPNLDGSRRNGIRAFALRWEKSSRKTTQVRAGKVLKLLET